MFIVTGATGNTGSVVAKTLLDKGLPVRVVVRSEEKGKHWREQGAEVAIANLQDADVLTKALAGGKVLYLMNPPNEQAESAFEETEKNIAAANTAIENSSLEKLVVLSSEGAQHASGTGLILTNHRFEEAFKNARIPTTFVRAAYFMENWNSSLETVKNDGVLPSFVQPLDKQFWQVAAEDIGRVAAEAMLETSDGLQIKELAGFMVSSNDVAAAFSKVLGREIKAVAVPEEQWLDIFKTFSSPKNAEGYVEMTRAMNADLATFETDDLIKGTVTVEDYARKVLQ
jgi:uncharacterized protein YbjT (DUF2867 family)